MVHLQYALLAGLAIALVFAAITDIRSRKIYNSLNAAIALAAPAFWFASGMGLWPDMALQLGFALLVFAAFAGLFALGMIGGGDVKLLGALALWFTPYVFLQLLIVMAMIGGLIAVGFMVRRVVFKPETPGKLPYGVAITAGALWVMAVTYWPPAGLA
ncbi:MAG: prepilin peptidase [Erythrobacter sp.]|jgi:prepilin peptidase CpaA|nr:prepilin peptidase [Erythrobacter sp.]